MKWEEISFEQISDGKPFVPAILLYHEEKQVWLREIIDQPSPPSADYWNKVEDGLPDSIWNDTEQEYYKRFSKQVNVFLDNGYVTTCAYNRETKKWFTGGLTKETGYREVAEGVNVTHWMPLPKPPSEQLKINPTDKEG